METKAAMRNIEHMSEQELVGSSVSVAAAPQAAKAGGCLTLI